MFTFLGTIKLCDFGSATTDIYTPNPSWSANQRNMLEENVSTIIFFMIDVISVVYYIKI